MRSRSDGSSSGGVAVASATSRAWQTVRNVSNGSGRGVVSPSARGHRVSYMASAPRPARTSATTATSFCVCDITIRCCGSSGGLTRCRRGATLPKTAAAVAGTLYARLIPHYTTCRP